MYKLGVLLIHGFAGSRDEVRALYEKLIENNIYAQMVLIKGHEGTPKDLARTTYKDWIESTRVEYLDMIEKCQKIIVVGFSTGGLIAVNLYREFKFDKLITINTPIYYWNILQVCLNIKSDFKKHLPMYIKTCTDKKLTSLINFLKILRKTKPYFKDVECDTLIIQVRDDDTSNYKSGCYIYNNIKGNKTLLTPLHGGHRILMGEHKDEIIAEVLKYIISHSKY